MSNVAILYGVYAFEANKAGSRVEAIDFAENNVSELATLLADKNVLGAEVIAPKNPSKNVMLVELSKVRDQDGSFENAFLYICSHGKPVRGKLHLYGSDTVKEHEDQTSIAFADLRDIFIRIRAKNHIVILDCCYSGLAITQAPTDIGRHLASESIKALTEVAEIEWKSSEKSFRKAERGGFTICSSPPASLSDSMLNDGAFTAFSGALIKVIRGGDSDTTIEKLSMEDVARRTKTILKTKHPEPYYSDMNGFGKMPLIGNRFRFSKGASIEAVEAKVSLLQSQIDNISQRLPPEKWPTEKAQDKGGGFFSLFSSNSEPPYSDIWKLVSKGRSNGASPDLIYNTEAHVLGEPDVVGRFLLFLGSCVAIPIIEGSFRDTRDWNALLFTGEESYWGALKFLTLGFPVTTILMCGLLLLAVARPFRRNVLHLDDAWRKESGGHYASDLESLKHRSKLLLKSPKVRVGGAVVNVSSLKAGVMACALLAALISGTWAVYRSAPPSFFSYSLSMHAPTWMRSDRIDNTISNFDYSEWKEFTIQDPDSARSDRDVWIEYDSAYGEMQAVWIARRLVSLDWSVRLKPKIAKKDQNSRNEIHVFFPYDTILAPD